jgi:aryl-alcohol dehydrogenase-like predicted oxidoreductase
MRSCVCLREALDRGINFYDTSDLYGNGRSEKVLGTAFRDVRDQVILATKVGLAPHTVMLSPASVRTALDGSLRRLETDYVDLYQLHSPEVEYLCGHPEVFDTLIALRREGKVRAVGLSARSPAGAVAALSQFDFDAVQVNFNLIDHRAFDDGLFALVRERGVAVIARTPLCFGYLTGRLSGKKDFQGQDHRARWPEDQLQRWAAAPGVFTHLWARRKCTPAQFALLFSLSPETVATTIPGMMRCEEVVENVGVCDLPPLTDVELDEILAIYRAHNFYAPSATLQVQ